SSRSNTLSLHDALPSSEPRPVSIAGRIMSRRIMGKASFMELQDSEGRIQVYISRDDICPEENKDLYNIVFKKLLDIGDFVGIKRSEEHTSELQSRFDIV